MTRCQAYHWEFDLIRLSRTIIYFVGIKELGQPEPEERPGSEITPDRPRTRHCPGLPLLLPLDRLLHVIFSELRASPVDPCVSAQRCPLLGEFLERRCLRVGSRHRTTTSRAQSSSTSRFSSEWTPS